MNIKGTAYITRKDTIIKTFGEERWNTFLAKLAAKDKYFSQTIMNVTLIPLDKFIIFLDDVLKEFFNNDINHYWKLGEKSAEFLSFNGRPVPLLSSNKGYKAVGRVCHAEDMVDLF